MVEVGVAAEVGVAVAVAVGISDASIGSGRRNGETYHEIYRNPSTDHWVNAAARRPRKTCC